jgi:outer membrane protein TolC
MSRFEGDSPHKLQRVRIHQHEGLGRPKDAEIGVARAAYFPRLTLSGALGGASTQLTSLFSADHSTWNLAPQVTQPIFTAGWIKSGVKFAEAQRERALIRYEKTIQTAFTEVSDALIARQRVRERREKEAALVATLEDRVRLAYVRYRGGVDTQLNALDSDRDLFQAQLDLARIRLEELLTVVQLYKALGGRMAVSVGDDSRSWPQKALRQTPG